MKKAMILLTAMLTTASMVMADEVTADQVTIPQGGTAMLSISLTNPDNTYTAGQMVLALPDGVTAVLKDNGDPTVENGGRIVSTNHSIGASHLSDGTEQFTIFSISSEAIVGSDGVLFSAVVKADKSLAIGTTLEGRLIDIEMTTTDGVRMLFNDQAFTITISEPVDPRVTLDESSTTVIETATGVDVRVLRTLKAGEWSTLCLPFAMTDEQARSAFGEDVQIARFKGWETTEWDDDDNATAIEVTFSSASAVEANIPCLIKVSEDVSEFTADAVDIDPDNEPCVTVGKTNRGTFGSFTGSYTPITIDEECLFLNGNNFWYSKGTTKMKGYRAYFYFQDVLADYSKASNARIAWKVTDDSTQGISLTPSASHREDGNIYTLDGRQIQRSTLRKGVYVKQGKKVIVK